MSLFDFLVQQFYTNEFMTAAVVAAPMTALVFMARSLPITIFTFAKRALTIEVGFNSDTPDYEAAQIMITEKIVRERWSRTFQYSAQERWDNMVGEDVIDYAGLAIGYGAHYGWYKGRLVIINRHLADGQQTEKFKEQTRLTFFTRKRAIVDSFAADVRAHGERKREDERISLFINNDNFWQVGGRLPKRSLDTVFTADRQKERIVEHILSFEANKPWYRRRGLPYHTGILLTGTPGTGKTSLIHAIASEVGRNLHYLNLGSVENDRQLTSLVSSARRWDRAILVIEDADASGVDVGERDEASSGAAAPRERSLVALPLNLRRALASGQLKPSQFKGFKGGGKAKRKAPVPRKSVTLSALLNVLDGLLTPDGLVVIATSNHPDRLDPALIRAGRFDLQLEMGDLDWESFVAMANLFEYPLELASALKAKYVPASGATIRSLLIAGGVDAVMSRALIAEPATPKSRKGKKK